MMNLVRKVLNVKNKAVVATVVDEPVVTDLRPDGAASLANVPRLSTFTELLSWFNITVNRDQGWDAAPADALVWKVVGFYIRDGVASFIPKFQLENGNPADGIAVVHSWPGAPALPNPDSITPDYSGKKGVVGYTNGSGDAGFPYSGGMVYSGAKPYSGSGVIWPLCPQHLSEPKYADAVFGLGWVGGTDHTTVNPIFKLVRKTGGGTPTTGEYSIVLEIDGQPVGKLVFSNDITTGNQKMVLYQGGNRLGEIAWQAI